MLKKGSVANNIFKFNERILINKNNSINKLKRKIPTAFNFLFILEFNAPSSNNIRLSNPNKIIGWVKFSSRFSVLEHISNIA